MEKAHEAPSLVALLPIMAAVFVGFLVTGLAMPVLPLHVHGTLGQVTFVVGLITGAQFGVSLLSRPWAGWQADSRGVKRTMIVGLLLAAASGVLYAASLWSALTPGCSAAILLVGRAIMGVSESTMITAAQAWGLILLGALNTGRVIAWIGTAMYGAFALGAPMGVFFYERYGFTAIAELTIAMPILTLACVAPLASVAPTAETRGSITNVLRAVWLPGLGAALSSVGFGSMIAFSSLLFASRGWLIWPAFSVFAGAFMASRLFLGQATDKYEPARVALVCVVIEAAGLFIIALAAVFVIALVGCALTGFGLSLVYPAFGVEAVRRAPAQDRGLAMGAYTAFLDLALGVSGPALGLLAQAAGLASAFTASAVAALVSAVVAISFIVHKRAKQPIHADRP